MHPTKNVLDYASFSFLSLVKQLHNASSLFLINCKLIAGLDWPQIKYLIIHRLWKFLNSSFYFAFLRYELAAVVECGWEMKYFFEEFGNINWFFEVIDGELDLLQEDLIKYDDLLRLLFGVVANGDNIIETIGQPEVGAD